MIRAESRDSKEHLCGTCRNTYPDCCNSAEAAGDEQELTFGDGKGNDNVIGCNTYVPKGRGAVEEGSREKRGSFLKGMPLTHRSCRNVDYSREKDYACKINGKTFMDLDEKCQFELETEVTIKVKSKSQECKGYGLIPENE